MVLSSSFFIQEMLIEMTISIEAQAKLRIEYNVRFLSKTFFRRQSFGGVVELLYIFGVTYLPP